MIAGWFLLIAAVIAALGWFGRQRLLSLEDRAREAPSRADLDELRQKSALRFEELRQEKVAAVCKMRDVRTEMQQQNEEVRSLRSELSELRQSVADLQGQMVEMLAQVHRMSAASSAATAGNSEPLAEIQRVLDKQGFVDIRAVGEVLGGDAKAAVQVEARRAGASYKGFVHLVDGRVERTRLTASYQAFP